MASQSGGTKETKTVPSIAHLISPWTEKYFKSLKGRDLDGMHMIQATCRLCQKEEQFSIHLVPAEFAADRLRHHITATHYEFIDYTGRTLLFLY